MPRVFLSYSHDSDEHRKRVLGLAERLRKSGIDAWLDQYEQGTPAQTWPRWMLDELEKAAFVLVVSTETYYRRFRGHEVGKGKGADWEGALITQELYDAKSRTVKFVPVTLAAGLEGFIPEPLRGRTFYELTSEARYADLVTFLFGRAGVEPAPLGTAVVAPRRRGEPLTFGDEEPLVDVGHLPSTIVEKLIGREAELAELDAAWSSAEVRVLSVVAVGGAGKTALVHHWMQGFEQAGWKAKGASAAFAWSFYSQGASDDRQASGDVFIERALAHFGDPDPKEGSAHDRGTRLAGLVRRHRALLILDGLEPLQEPPSSVEAGKVKDPAVAALLRSLADDNPGLLVVTSREPVLDLRSREGRGARTLDLGTLRDEAGTALLRWLGVKGPEDELRAVSKDVHGHAFTLTLLGSFLRDAHEGDVRAWKDLSLFAAADLVGNPQASRMMAAYSSWFGKGPEQQILALVGLFDRPAAADLVAALREKPAIPEVTDELIDLSEARWKVALSRLRKARLLLEEDAPGALDAHPLVREHFGRRLRERHPDAWKAAHGRLFDHLKDTAERWPDTLIGLGPLYQAVVHGCRAGRHEEACEDVYRDRINRGHEFFSAHQLGAFGADLGAIASFFDPPWRRVVPSLAEATQTWLLNEAAFRLRALGRLTEAVEPMRMGLQRLVEAENWRVAAVSAGNLSELELNLGDVATSVRDAEQSVGFADRSGDAFWRMTCRTTHAYALHAAGRHDEALVLFREAEAMQAKQGPEYPLLYSLRGFLCCDVLLTGSERAAGGGRRDGGAIATCHEVERRATQTLKWVTSQRWLLDAALDHLTLGRAHLYRAIFDGPRSRTRRPRSSRQSTDSAAQVLSSSSRTASSPAPGCAPSRATATPPAPTSTKPRRSPSAGRCPSTLPRSTSTALASFTTAPPSPRRGGWSRSMGIGGVARSSRISRPWRGAGADLAAPPPGRRAIRGEIPPCYLDDGMKVGVSLPDTLLAFADEEAKRRGTTRSGLLARLLEAEQVREGLRRYLDQHGWDVAEDEEAWRVYQQQRMAEEYRADEW